MHARHLQARTSTMRPLKSSSAFWMSGSFLKSSALGGSAPFFGAAGPDAACGARPEPWPLPGPGLALEVAAEGAEAADSEPSEMGGAEGADMAPAWPADTASACAVGRRATQCSGRSVLMNLICVLGRP